jgi:hypothetical protein
MTPLRFVDARSFLRNSLVAFVASCLTTVASASPNSWVSILALLAMASAMIIVGLTEAKREWDLESRAAFSGFSWVCGGGSGLVAGFWLVVAVHIGDEMNFVRVLLFAPMGVVLAMILSIGIALTVGVARRKHPVSGPTK